MPLIELTPDFFNLVLAFLAKIFILAALICTPIYYFYNRVIRKNEKQEKKQLMWKDMGWSDRIKLNKKYNKELKRRENSILNQMKNRREEEIKGNSTTKEENPAKEETETNIDIAKLKELASKSISTAMKEHRIKRKEILVIKDLLKKNTKVRENKKYSNDLHCIYSLIKYSDPMEETLNQIIKYIEGVKKVA